MINILILLKDAALVAFSAVLVLNVSLVFLVLSSVHSMLMSVTYSENKFSRLIFLPFRYPVPLASILLIPAWVISGSSLCLAIFLSCLFVPAKYQVWVAIFALIASLREIERIKQTAKTGTSDMFVTPRMLREMRIPWAGEATRKLPSLEEDELKRLLLSGHIDIFIVTIFSTISSVSAFIYAIGGIGKYFHVIRGRPDILSCYRQTAFVFLNLSPIDVFDERLALLGRSLFLLMVLLLTVGFINISYSFSRDRALEDTERLSTEFESEERAMTEKVAYELWRAAGSPAGQDEEFWRMAEMAQTLQ